MGWRTDYETMVNALERFADDIDLPEYLYEPFCFGLMRVLYSLDEIKPPRRHRRPQKRKGNVVPFIRKGGSK